MDEFELIRRYFDRPIDRPEIVKGIGDDGAVIATQGAMVQVIDTLVEDVHFPAATDPEDIGFRAVAVNLSDIAAMGAVPHSMLLSLTLVEPDERWIGRFARGLFEAADAHELALIGGDTTRGSATVVTIAVNGVMPTDAEKTLQRDGARPGDSIYVTGTIGDAAAGLSLLQRGETNGYLTQRFLRPTPRVETGRALVGRATAAIDVSDGLVGDLKKLLDASDVGGELRVDRIPLSDALRERFDIGQCREFALGGGDDYELCFTAPPGVELPGVSAVGTVNEGRRLVCRIGDDVVAVDEGGYRHFS